MKRFLKNAALFILTFSLLLTCLSCTTAGGKWYVSKDKGVSAEKASSMIAEAQAVTDGFSDIQYTYSFFIELTTPDKKLYRLGTENILSFTDRGTPNAKGYRKNTYTSLPGDSLAVTEISEEFYYTDGNIYTKRFGKNYRSEMTDKEFAEYTEYSDISVNTDYLSESNFDTITVYQLFGDKKELVFTDANDNIKNGIAEFTGLNQTEYIYEVLDTTLSVLIGEDGSLLEKHLLFSVDYYDKKQPRSILTYEGDFAYTVNGTENITVPERDRSVAYTNMPNIALLSSITEKGYEVLAKQDFLDASYKKYVRVVDNTSKEYIFDALANITYRTDNGILSYGSIVSEYASTEKKLHNTTGIFFGSDGYHGREYDYVEDVRKTDLDQTHSKYTNEQYKTLVFSTLTTEQLFEDEIASVGFKSENDESVTFSVSFTGSAAKIYASYLLDTFSENENINSTNQAFTLLKCDIFITVRKSDGCILNQTIDFSGEIHGISGYMGSIGVEGSFEMNVRSTSSDVNLLGTSDFDSTVNSIKNS